MMFYSSTEWFLCFILTNIPDTAWLDIERSCKGTQSFSDSMVSSGLFQDSEYYNSLIWIQENDPADLEMTFSVEEDQFGEVSTFHCTL